MRNVRTSMLLAGVVLLTLSGCLAGPASPFSDAHPAGFFSGVWHGLLAPFTLLVSFVDDSIRMTEVHTVGPQYDMGFLFGIMLLLSTPAMLRTARRRGWWRLGRRLMRRR